MWTEEYQAELLKRQWRVITSKPYVAGAFVWGLIDFPTPQSHWRAFGNRKGVFTRTRQPKLAAKVVKDMFGEGERCARRKPWIADE